MSVQLPIRNQLLASLAPNILSGILPKLRQRSLSVRDTMITPGQEIDAVYFVESGWVSLVSTLEDGTQAEVGLVGREGMVGLPLIVGVSDGFEEAWVQAKGEALQMDATEFRRALAEVPDFRTLLFRYIEAMRSQTTQTAACNGRHGLEQRLARWLLMAHDRSDGENLPVTQEFLGLMLCVYRPSITVVAGVLQRAGIIRYERGRVIVLDRKALEATACDCYGSVKRRFDQLLSS
jgi:CRP-like cAMP-binding protein